MQFQAGTGGTTLFSGRRILNSQKQINKNSELFTLEIKLGYNVFLKINI